MTSLAGLVSTYRFAEGECLTGSIGKVQERWSIGARKVAYETLYHGEECNAIVVCTFR